MGIKEAQDYNIISVEAEYIRGTSTAVKQLNLIYNKYKDLLQLFTRTTCLHLPWKRIQFFIVNQNTLKRLPSLHPKIVQIRAS